MPSEAAMRWAYIEALEERALLSASAPADGDQRLLADVNLAVSVPAGRLIPTLGAVRDVLFDSQRNELFVFEQDRVDRFKADDWSKLDPLAMGSLALAADLSPNGRFLYVLNSESVSKIDLDSGESRVVAVRSAYNTIFFDLAVTLDGAIVSEADPAALPGQACNTISRISLVDDSVQQLMIDQSRSCFDYPFMLARSADFSYVSMTSTSEDFAIDNGTISGRENFAGAISSAVGRDGTFHAIAAPGEVLIENKTFQAVARFPIRQAQVAFDPSGDVMFAASRQDMRLHAYDTTTWNELYSVEIPDALERISGWGNGSMSISADGASMFMAVDEGVRTFGLTRSSAFYGIGFNFIADVSSHDGVIGVYGGVSFIDEATQSSFGTVLLSNGRATLVIDDLPARAYSIIAQYLGNDLFQPAESLPVDFVVRKAATSVDLNFQNWESATVTVAADAGTPMGGSVSLWEEDQLIRTVALLTPAVQIPLSLSRGWHTLSARYSGSSNFEISQSSERTILVPDESVMSVVQSSTTTPYAKAVIFSATVTRLPTMAGMEPGLVVLYDGETALTQGNVDFEGHASFTVDQLAPGVHNIYAKFLGSFSLQPSASDPISHTVEKALTMITISAPSVSDWDHAWVLAKVTSNSGLPLNVGFVELYSDGRRTNVEQVQNGQANLRAQVPAGINTITARYVGTDNINGSTSNAVRVRILRGLSSVTLTPSRNWQIKGDPIVWKATVNVVRQGGLPRTGLVRFNEGKRVLARVPVDFDTATFTTTSLGAGDHTLTATYVPDSASWIASSGSAKATIVAATTVDLMVMYTDQAMTNEGGEEEIRRVVDDAVDGTNLAFLNSHIPVRMRLVHVEAITYHESGRFSRDLNRLALPHDGFMDQVHALRRQYRADLVSLLVADGDLAGIGFELTDVHDRTNAKFGFSVVWAAQAAGPKYALAHELGHNFGASHDVEHSDGLGATTFSHGYRFRVGRPLYHDIMSYDPGQTIPYFSNPRIKYKGVPTGTADSADAARTITMTAPFVAKYL